MTYHQRAPCYGTRLDLGAGISYASLPDVFRAKNEKKKTNLGLGSGVAGSSLPDFPQLAAESFDEQSEAGSEIEFDDGYIFRFGRRYRHRLPWEDLKDTGENSYARYLCPNDEQEQDRRDLQHAVLYTLFENNLRFAPLSTTSRIEVLDVCTGTGVWAVDVADECPEWAVEGVDWSPEQPTWVPPNLSFFLDDMRLPWCFDKKFDYIHTRATMYMGCWGDFKNEVVQQAFDNLHPGGWFESQEIGSLVECDDKSLQFDAPLATWARIFYQAGLSMGRPRDAADKMCEWYKEVGFVDVEQRVFKMPIGPWAKCPRLKETGKYWQVCMDDALEGLSLRLFNEAFGWDEAKTKELLSRVKKDFMRFDGDVHAYTKVYVVTGRKPLAISSESGLTKTISMDTKGGPDATILRHRTSRLTPSLLPGISHSSISIDTSSADTWEDTSCSNKVDESVSGNRDAGSVYFRKQRDEFVNDIIWKLCQYLDSKVADARLQKLASLSIENPQDSGEPSGSTCADAPALEKAPEDGAASTQSAIAIEKQGVGSLDRGGGDEDGEEDGDNRRRKRPRVAISGETRKLACPYFKRTPIKYSKWTSCPGPGWDEIHRVKAHLYKRHALPLQCPRCWEPFRAEAAYREHLQQDPPCAVQADQKSIDGYTKEQERMLRSRRRTRPDMTRVDKWNEIYHILFPDDDVTNMPSPYYDSSDGDRMAVIEDYAVFLRREMPAVVRRELDAVFQDEWRILEETLRPRIEQMIVDLQPRMLRMFQQSEATSDEEQLPESEELPPGLDSSQPAFQGLELGADQCLPIDYPEDVELAWDINPSLSESTATAFAEPFLDINFEKLLDSSFNPAEIGCTRLDSHLQGNQGPDTGTD